MMEDFCLFFSIFQLLAALNIAQVSSGFRSGFYKIIENWDNEIRKYTDIKSRFTILSENLKGNAERVQNNFKDDEEKFNLKQRIDAAYLGCCSESSSFTKKVNKLINCSFEEISDGRSKDCDSDVVLARIDKSNRLKDPYIPCFLFSGFSCFFSMFFLAISNCYACTTLISFFFIIYSLLFSIICNILIHFHINCIKCDERNVLRFLVIGILLCALMFFSMFSDWCRGLYGSLNYNNGRSIVCLSFLLVLVTASISYIHCAIDVIFIVRQRRKAINLEFEQEREYIKKIEDSNRRFSDFIETKMFLSSPVGENNGSMGVSGLNDGAITELKIINRISLDATEFTHMRDGGVIRRIRRK